MFFWQVLLLLLELGQMGELKNIVIVMMQLEREWIRSIDGKQVFVGEKEMFLWGQQHDRIEINYHKSHLILLNRICRSKKGGREWLEENHFLTGQTLHKKVSKQVSNTGYKPEVIMKTRSIKLKRKRLIWNFRKKNLKSEKYLPRGLNLSKKIFFLSHNCKAIFLLLLPHFMGWQEIKNNPLFHSAKYFDCCFLIFLAEGILCYMSPKQSW